MYMGHWYWPNKISVNGFGNQAAAPSTGSGWNRINFWCCDPDQASYMEFIQSGRNLKYVHSQIRSISVKVACDFIYCPPKLIAAVDVSQGRGRHHCSSLVTAASCRENPVKLFSALLWQGLMNSQGCCQTYVVSAVIVCMLKRGVYALSAEQLLYQQYLT